MSESTSSLRQLNSLGNAFKFKFYLNSMHAVLFNDKSSPIHKHTWEVSLNLRELVVEFSEFYKIEKKINDYLNTYNDKVLNDVYPFTKLNPTMENMGFVFFQDINILTAGSNYVLETLEISENPTRTYIVNKIMNYKVMESDSHQEKMTPILNEMRGIKMTHGPWKASESTASNTSDPQMSVELNKALSNISRNFEEMNKTHEVRHKKRKKAFRVKLFVTFIVLTLLGAAGYYFLYIKEIL